MIAAPAKKYVETREQKDRRIELLKRRRINEFFDAALTYYAVSNAYSNHRPVDGPDPVAAELSRALHHTEDALNNAGKLVLGAGSKLRAQLVRDAILESARTKEEKTLALTEGR